MVPGFPAIAPLPTPQRKRIRTKKVINALIHSSKRRSEAIRSVLPSIKRSVRSRDNALLNPPPLGSSPVWAASWALVHTRRGAVVNTFKILRSAFGSCDCQYFESADPIGSVSRPLWATYCSSTSTRVFFGVKVRDRLLKRGFLQSPGAPTLARFRILAPATCYS